MEIIRTACAGTEGSNDIMIEISPCSEGICVELDSCMEKLYGKTIREVIRRSAEQMGVENALIRAKDNGALDYTIEARVETAVRRACT